VVTVQRRGGGPLLPAVANYGTRHTVENAGEPLLESHLLVPCDLGEGDEILVQWLEMLRPELRLGSLDELKTRIARDADSGRAYFQRHMPELLHLT
jgi:FAD synthase